MNIGTIIRTVVLVFALLNQILVAFGKSPLPFDEVEVEQGVSAIITASAALWAWWKDNDVTKQAIERKKKVSL